MVISTEEILRLLLAIVAGGALGLERELHHKAAGFRTITLICLGSALVTMLAQRMNIPQAVANIVTGIGFLGAGVIMREGGSRVTGITTAATVWLSACLGIGIGAGAYLLTLLGTLLILVVMRVLNQVEYRIDKLWDMCRYEVTLPPNSTKADELDAQLRHCGLQVGVKQRLKRDGRLLCIWEAAGSHDRHSRFIEMVLNDPEIQDFEY